MEMPINKKLLPLLVVGVLILSLAIIIGTHFNKPSIDIEFRKICLEIKKRQSTLNHNAPIDSKEWREYFEWVQAGGSHLFWIEMYKKNGDKNKKIILQDECLQVGVEIEET